MADAHDAEEPVDVEVEAEEVVVDVLPVQSPALAQTAGAGVVDMTEAGWTAPSGADEGGVPWEKLETAWEHLRKNELDEALAISKDVARAYPEVATAKMIIARCFINRKEYQKALAILRAIPEKDRHAEGLYYLGLCLSRMGNIPAAIESLEHSLAASEDEPTRKRAGDLLGHLKEEKGLCPECGRRITYAELVDFGNYTVCPDCARELAGETVPDEGPHLAPAGGPGPVAGFMKRLCRRVASLLALFALAYAVLYGASRYLPRQYEAVRARLPAAWTFLPKSGNTAPAETTEAATGGTLPTILTIDSEPLSHAVAGVPVVHRLSVDGMRGIEGEYEALFSPASKGRFRMEGKTGQFFWTPHEDDAGKTFDITFGATFKTARAKRQVNRVTVFSPPAFRNIHTLGAPEPGEVTHLLAWSPSAAAQPEIIAVSGSFWSSRVTVLQETVDGFFHPSGRAAFPGRSVGAGLASVAGETVLVVGDYWNSCLRYFTLANGQVEEMALRLPLPGRPVFAGFDEASGYSAVLCKRDNAMRLLCHRIVDPTHVEKVGEWAVPAGHAWRQLLVLPENPRAGARPRVLLIGGDPVKSVFLASPDRGDLSVVGLSIPGVLVNAVHDAAGRVHLLADENGSFTLVSFDIDGKGQAVRMHSLPVGQGPLINGMAALDVFGGGRSGDVALLSATRMEIAFREGKDDGVVGKWNLPAPSRLMGGAAVLPGKGGSVDRVVYQDVNGGLWCGGLDRKKE